jgi:hypothetical protein
VELADARLVAGRGCRRSGVHRWQHGVRRVGGFTDQFLIVSEYKLLKELVVETCQSNSVTYWARHPALHTGQHVLSPRWVLSPPWWRCHVVVCGMLLSKSAYEL